MPKILSIVTTFRMNQRIFKRKGKWISKLHPTHNSSNKKKIKVVYKNKGEKKKKTDNVNEQEMVDKILDKISKSGYDSLSKEEKDILFRASQKN